jgi:hypothetical protein
LGTLRDLVNGSLRLATIIGQNKAAQQPDIENALYALDTMQDSWSNEKLMIYSIQPYIFYTQPNQKVYTMGPANDTPGSITLYQLTAQNPGSGYTNGTYNNVPLIYTNNTIAGSITSGVFAVNGETITQAVSGATATLVSATTSPGNLVVVALSITGTPNNTNHWTGNTSGAIFTPTALPVSQGAGTGAKANIVVNLGQIIDVQVVNYGTSGTCGTNYVQGDQLTAVNTNIGNTGSGFVVMVAEATQQTNWIIPRPMKIEKAYTIWQAQNPQAVDIPIQILTMEQYASITVKDTPSTFSFALYDDNAYPVRDITVFPIPLMSVGIRFWLRQPLVVSELSQLDVEIDFPPGYERAFRYNLACELAPEYGKTLAQSVTATAMQTKEQLKQQNQSPRYKRGDGSLSRHGVAGRWNWITGNFFWGGWGS